ncbi:PhnA domain-containing protein [Streptomyces broussonetiae]|uniref:PhnA domain-containing protein n=1 Tax=Streptomyces broussonetiae TaxID=2686304 RepID=A0ABV5EAN3_9ACTN
MSDSLPACPACSGSYAYETGALLVCPECGHEWSPSEEPTEGAPGAKVDGTDGHDIDCKVDGSGAMQLKSGVVRKA